MTGRACTLAVLAGLTACAAPPPVAPAPAVDEVLEPVPVTDSTGRAEPMLPPIDVTDAHRGAQGPAVLDEPAPPSAVELPGGIRVDLAAGEVAFPAVVCIDVGWLEQVICTPGTREHEALLVADIRPSDLHAALVLIGLEPGRPGSWSYEDRTFTFHPPTGAAVAVRFDVAAIADEPVPPSAWIRGGDGRPFPDRDWLFAGSVIAENPPFMGPGEHYVADMTGSIMGLATFGDELLGFPEVISHEIAVQPAEWEVNTDRIPPMGTRITVRMRAGAAEVAGEAATGR
jgi:hypothetical protein